MGIILFDIPSGMPASDLLAGLHGLCPSEMRLRELPGEVPPLTAPEAVEAILCAWGPFYLCQFRFSRAGAVLVNGANTDLGTIYYRDPNACGMLRVQTYGEWVSRWLSGRETFRAQVAPCRQSSPRWQGMGGCPHAARAVRLKQSDGLARV